MIYNILVILPTPSCNTKLQFVTLRHISLYKLAKLNAFFFFHLFCFVPVTVSCWLRVRVRPSWQPKRKLRVWLWGNSMASPRTADHGTSPPLAGSFRSPAHGLSPVDKWHRLHRSVLQRRFQWDAFWRTKMYTFTIIYWITITCRVKLDLFCWNAAVETLEANCICPRHWNSCCTTN